MEPSGNRLTIAWALGYTAVMALTLTAFLALFPFGISQPAELAADDPVPTLAPPTFDWTNWEQLRMFATALLLGSSFYGGLWSLGWRLRGQRPADGGLLVLTLAGGILVLLPPILLDDETDVVEILVLRSMPLIGLWLLIASLVSGRWREVRGWSEQFGLLVGLGWSVLGAYVLWEVYHDTFW